MSSGERQAQGMLGRWHEGVLTSERADWEKAGKGNGIWRHRQGCRTRPTWVGEKRDSRTEKPALPPWRRRACRFPNKRAYRAASRRRSWCRHHRQATRRARLQEWYGSQRSRSACAQCEQANVGRCRPWLRLLRRPVNTGPTETVSVPLKLCSSSYRT